MQHALAVWLATLSRNERPSVAPIYFVVEEGHIWIGTVVWTIGLRSYLTHVHRLRRLHCYHIQDDDKGGAHHQRDA